MKKIGFTLRKQQKVDPTASLPGNDNPGAKVALQRAVLEKDPLRRYNTLKRLEEMNPNELTIQKALLMLGALWQRDGRHPNRALIKCYLFHSLEEPESYAEAEQKRKAREFFDHPRLLRCLELAPDPNAFLREYLSELSRQYIDCFIREEKRHVPGMLGLVSARKLPRYMAVPAHKIIQNTFLCPFLSEEEKKLLAGCFYRAFYQAVDGQTEALDRALGREIRGLIQ